MICAPARPHVLALDRRSLLAALASGAFVVACDNNPELGRSQFAIVPDEQVAEMADQAWADLLAQAPQVRDPALAGRLDQVGRRVAGVSGREALAWEFVVFDRPEVNAFVLPNGKVAAFRGLMELARDDDELAGVIGHEVGHVLARHPAERLSQQLAVELGVAAVQLALSGGEYGEHASEIAGALGMGALYGVILPYSRAHELEADRLGVTLAARAGFDPAGALRFFERMAEVSDRRDQPPEVLSTHPADSTRLTALREVLARMGSA